MTRAERELHALKREMLLARAAAERAALAHQLDTLEARSHSGVAGLILGGAQRARASGWLDVATSAVRIARSRPWLLPAVVGGITRLTRSRTLLRYMALAGAVAVAVWWLRKRRAAALQDAAGAEAGEPLSGVDDY